MNTRIARTLTIAAHAALLSSTVSLLFGCAVVKINKDDTDSVEHSGGEARGKELANLACHKARAVRAEVISTVKKDADGKEGEGRYVTEFRCLY